MLSIIYHIIKISFITSSIILLYFLIIEIKNKILKEYYSLKYKNNIILKDKLIWSMYKHKRLKYILTDFEYNSCKELDLSLRYFYKTLNSRLFTNEERNRLSKSIKKDILNLKTLKDVYDLNIKVTNITLYNKHTNFINDNKKVNKKNNFKVIELKKVKN